MGVLSRFYQSFRIHNNVPKNIRECYSMKIFAKEHILQPIMQSTYVRVCVSACKNMPLYINENSCIYTYLYP